MSRRRMSRVEKETTKTTPGRAHHNIVKNEPEASIDRVFLYEH